MAGGTYVRIEGIEECLNAFKGLEGELRKNANGELRAASKQIARGLVPLIGGSSAPQEAAIIAAAGPKSDRYVVLAVPARKPKLSGLKRTPAAQAKRLGWAIEGGSDYPAFHNPAAGSIAAKHRTEMARYAVPRYLRAVNGIMRKYQLL
jgi:hypothetical protein